MSSLLMIPLTQRASVRMCVKNLRGISTTPFRHSSFAGKKRPPSWTESQERYFQDEYVKECAPYLEQGLNPPPEDFSFEQSQQPYKTATGLFIGWSVVIYLILGWFKGKAAGKTIKAENKMLKDEMSEEVELLYFPEDEIAEKLRARPVMTYGGTVSRPGNH